MIIRPLDTHYAGYRFRSRLAARWAVFFDALGIAWEYQPEGYLIDDTPYLPDFLLPESGTWIEVVGRTGGIDTSLMRAAALQLPQMRRGVSPRLMILGPIPAPRAHGDWGWVGLQPIRDESKELEVIGGHFGFGSYGKDNRPWALFNTSCADAYTSGDPASAWLTPSLDPHESGASEGYLAARSARFEDDI